MTNNNRSLPSTLEDENTLTSLQPSGLAIVPLGGVASLPSIQANERELPHLLDDCVNALLQANDPPQLFVFGNTLASVTKEKDRQPSIIPMDVALLGDYLGRAARFYQKRSYYGNVTEVPAIPPKHAVKGVLARVREQGSSLGFPALEGLTDVPVLRPDGTILDQPGYDDRTHLIYVPASGFSVPPIPTVRLGPLGSCLATVPIMDILADFPFVDEASLANAVGKMLTPIVRPAISGHVPLGVTTAPRAGTGKGLLDDVVLRIATGSEAAKRTVPTTEDEFRKSLTSILMAGDRNVVFDNIPNGTSLDSAVLASCLTTTIYQDRPLGTNSTPRLPQRTVFAANGNNVRLGGDMPRRVYLIKLDAKVRHPWKRKTFRHPNLLQFVKQNRSELVTALLIMVSQWDLAGRPLAPESMPVLGSFEEWSRVIGGILHYWGINGFLQNCDELYESDPTEHQWEEFLFWIYRNSDGEEFTTKDVLGSGAWPVSVCGQISLPDDVSGKGYESRSRSLGAAFGDRIGLRSGEDSVRVEKVLRSDGKSKVSSGVQVWRIAVGEES